MSEAELLGKCGVRVFRAWKKGNPLLRLFAAGGTAAAVFTADRLFKNSINTQPDEHFPHPIPGALGETVQFEKFHNDGFILGAGRKYPQLIRALPALMIGAACAQLASLLPKQRSGLERFGLSLLIGGGLSNLFDRVRLGYVVDYIGIKRGVLKRIVLNIGDLAIFAGILLAALGNALRGGK